MATKNRIFDSILDHGYPPKTMATKIEQREKVGLPAFWLSKDGYENQPRFGSVENDVLAILRMDGHENTSGGWYSE